MAVVKVKSPPKIKNPSGKQRRSVGKVLNLAATYGMGGSTAGARLGKSAKEGQQLLDNFFKGFPKVKQAIQYSKQFLREHGYVEDFVGRRRHLPDIYLPPYQATYKDSAKVEQLTFNPILTCKDRPLCDPTLNSFVEKAKSTRGNKEFDALAKEARKQGIILTANTGRIARAERQCFNGRIQGSAASLTKLAMIDIFNNERMKQLDANLVISVHDEVLVECPALYADQVEVLLPKIMVDAAAAYDDVPQACDPYQVFHWYQEEYTAGIIEKYKDLTAKGKTKQEAIDYICKSYPQLSYEQVDQAIVTGQNIKFE